MTAVLELRRSRSTASLSAPLALGRRAADRPRDGAASAPATIRSGPRSGRSDLRLGPRVEVGARRLEQRRARRPGTANVLTARCASSVAHDAGERVAELLVGERHGATVVARVRSAGDDDRSAEIGSGSTQRCGRGELATDASLQPRPARISVRSPPTESTDGRRTPLQRPTASTWRPLPRRWSATRAVAAGRTSARVAGRTGHVGVIVESADGRSTTRRTAGRVRARAADRPARARPATAATDAIRLARPRTPCARSAGAKSTRPARVVGTGTPSPAVSSMTTTTSPAPTVSPAATLISLDRAGLLGGDLVLHLHRLEHAAPPDRPRPPRRPRRAPSRSCPASARRPCRCPAAPPRTAPRPGAGAGRALLRRRRRGRGRLGHPQLHGEALAVDLDRRRALDAAARPRRRRPAAAASGAAARRRSRRRARPRPTWSSARRRRSRGARGSRGRPGSSWRRPRSRSRSSARIMRAMRRRRGRAPHDELADEVVVVLADSSSPAS